MLHFVRSYLYPRLDQQELQERQQQHQEKLQQHHADHLVRCVQQFELDNSIQQLPPDDILKQFYNEPVNFFMPG